MGAYQEFIPQNIALTGSRRIGIYNAQGNRVGQMPLGSLTPPNSVKKMYSFGALSDVHIVYSTAADDFKRALTYLNDDVDVAFTCICGDLTDDGSAAQLEQYKAIVDSHSADTPVYAIAGNHEHYNNTSSAYLADYTGHPLYYSFTHGEDVFLMLGCYSEAYDGVFTNECLQWVYETLEANRNKRCFIFEHVFPWGDSGNPGELYHSDLFTGTKGRKFQSLLKHYKNTVLFHGHSHTKFELQDIDKKANYSDALGYRSVHIPSLAVPRDIKEGELTYIYADSEGYVVDVYKDGIHLRGRDFVKGEFLPVASYWIDTTLQTVEAGTYTEFVNQVPISTDTDGSIYNGVGYKENIRLSSSGGISGTAQDGSVTTGFIPWYGDTTYLRLAGVTWEHESGKHYYVNFYDSSKKFLSYLSAAEALNLTHIVTITRENGVTTIKYNESYGTTNTHLQHVRNTAKYIRITAKGKGADMIVTLN